MQRQVRITIEETIFRRFKVICAEMDLSLSKQLTQVVCNFVEVQEENIKALRRAKEEK